MRMKISYRVEGDAVYLRLRRKSKAGRLHTKALGDWMFADFDLNDQLVGLEVLDASYHFGKTACLAMARHSKRPALKRRMPYRVMVARIPERKRRARP